jgi:hypothetical protein
LSGFRTSHALGGGLKKSRELDGCLWLTPVILATQEAEIRRTLVPSQETLSRKIPITHKKRTGGVAQYQY